jgi:Fe-S cluster assembly ATP-binding protein
LLAAMRELEIDPAFIYRDMHDGFSGGEKKKLELLQLLILKPKIAILDEIDSGLDIDALKIVARGLEMARAQNPEMSILIITHYQRILNYITPHFVHVICDGKLIASGDVQLAHQLELKGYDGYRQLHL